MTEAVEWQQLRVRVARADVARAEALLNLAGALAIALDDASPSDNAPVLEPRPGETPLWATVELAALFAPASDLTALASMLADIALPGTRLRAERIDAAVLASAALRAPRPRAIGTRLWLAPRGAVGPPARLQVELNMGLAFGTGEHATTALCLEWLDAELAPGAAVLDFGCGSGVLAIAALVLGARRAWAVDNDEQALTATRDNARLNGIDDERLVVTAPETLGRIEPDVIVANIVADPLVELAPRFAELLRPGGQVVLSGVLEAQGERVAAAYAPHFTRLRSTARDGWLRISGFRSSATHARSG